MSSGKGKQAKNKSISADKSKQAKKKVTKQSKKAKKSKKEQKKLPGSFSLFGRMFTNVKRHWLAIGGLVLIHGVLQVLFAFDMTLSEGQTFFSSFLIAIFSLSYIWVFREQQQDDPQVRVSHAIYSGPSQIVPFVVLILLASIQLIPFTFGAFLYQVAVITGGIAVYYWEKLLFAGLWLTLAIPSAYWLATTVISLVVVAIPGVKPLEAWRATRDLVKPRIGQVLWRLGGFVVVSFVLLIGLFWFLLWNQYFTLAIRAPIMINIVVLPFFWSYIFSLYTALREL